MRKGITVKIIILMILVLFIGVLGQRINDMKNSELNEKYLSFSKSNSRSGSDTHMDSDFDGLRNTMESYYGTDPNDKDSDDDGVIDSDEVHWNSDDDKDGLINALDPDSDNDGITDGTEIGIVEPNKDTDITSTFSESSRKTFTPDNNPTTITNMTKKDTDNDGLFDGWNDTNKNGILDENETKGEDLNFDGYQDTNELNPLNLDTDNDGVLDGYILEGIIYEGNLDSDNDGIINGLEFDSDNDGVYDCVELGITIEMLTNDTDLDLGYYISDNNPNPAFNTNPCNSDSDDDGIPDGIEDKDHNGAINGDTNNNYLYDDDEIWFETNPLNKDSDSDGLFDGYNGSLGKGEIAEDKNNDGIVDNDETDPLNKDTDDDGLWDSYETNDGNYSDETHTGTNPLNNDTDGDNLLDGMEIEYNINPTKIDSDFDKMPDNWELKYSLNPLDPKDNLSDPDNDGFSNLAEYFGTDSLPGNNDWTDPKNESSHPPFKDKESNKDIEGGGRSSSLIPLPIEIIILIVVVIIIILILSLLIIMKKRKTTSYMIKNNITQQQFRSPSNIEYTNMDQKSTPYYQSNMTQPISYPTEQISSQKPKQLSFETQTYSQPQTQPQMTYDTYNSPDQVYGYTQTQYSTSQNGFQDISTQFKDENKLDSTNTELRLTLQQKLNLLDERLLVGDIDQNVYRDLKAKFELELEQSQPTQQEQISSEQFQQYQEPIQTPVQAPITQQPILSSTQEMRQQPNQEQFEIQNTTCPICQNIIAIYSDPCPYCRTNLDW